MTEPRLVDFNALPKAVRERLVGCFQRANTPRPFLSAEAPRASRAGWAALAAGGVGLAAATALYRFGQAVQGAQAMALYGAGVALVVFALLGARAVRARRAALPFEPGRYVLPTELVDASGPTLRLVSMRMLIAVTAVHRHQGGEYTGTAISLRFKGGLEEVFVVHGRELAERVTRDISKAQMILREAAAVEDEGVLCALDPFFAARPFDVWSPPAEGCAAAGPRVRPLGRLTRRPAMATLAVALGLALAAPLLCARNRLSDEAMFQRALRADTELAFEAYLATGKRHEGEVRASLLPRAALKEAAQKGSVTALRRFLVRYPKSCVDGEARAGIHALFAGTLGAFRERASTADPRLLPFMERLIAYLEAHEGSRLEARFHSPSAATLAAVDAALKLRASRAGARKIVPVAPHFDDVHAIPREASIVRGLQEGFATVFPADVLRIDIGQRLVSPVSQKAQVDKAALGLDEPPLGPTLDVRYRVGWAGDIYSEDNGDRQFVGIVVYFDVSMRIPDQPEAFDFALEVTPPDHFAVDALSVDDPRKRGRGAPSPGDAPSEGQVYDVMAERAFDQLTDKLRAIFFRPGNQAIDDQNIDDPADGPRPSSRAGSDTRPTEPPRRRGIQL